MIGGRGGRLRESYRRRGKVLKAKLLLSLGLGDPGSQITLCGEDYVASLTCLRENFCRIPLRGETHRCDKIGSYKPLQILT